MTGETRILFVEDSQADWELARRELMKSGMTFSCMRVDREKDFLGALESFDPDIVVSDYCMPEFDGARALALSLERSPGVPFVVLTGSVNETTAVECMKAGASDYVLKRHIARLPYAVAEALGRKREREESRAVFDRLLESEQKFRTLADSGLAMIWTSGMDMKCDWFNGVWLEFTGRPIERELGDGWTESVHPEDLPGCIKTYVDAFGKRQPFSMAYRLRRHDGEYRWIQDVGSPRNDLSGSFLGYIGHCMDVTELVEAKETAKRALDERDVLLRELYHRINNNLQVIISLLEMQAARSGDGTTRDFFMDVENRIVSMAIIHQQLYRSHDLSRIDLSEYFRDLTDQLFENFSVNPSSIEFAFEVEPIMTLVDTALPLGMVYNELLTNSLKHAFPSGRGGRIKLAARKIANERIELLYSDDGVGVPENFDFRGQKSIGLQTVFGISENQLLGKAEPVSGRGLSWRIEVVANLYAKRV